MVNALTASSNSLLGGGSTSTVDALYQRMQTRTTQEVTQKTQKLDDELNARYERIGDVEDALVNLKSDMILTQKGYEKAERSLGEIYDELLSLRSTIGDASDSYEYASKQFDQAILRMNIDANSYSADKNPIGNLKSPDWEGNEITYRTDMMVGTRTLQGTFAGSEFKITMADGTVWRPESGSSVMQRVNPDGSLDEDMEISMLNGIELASYDETTGEVTLNMTYSAEDPPFSVTGTIERGGLGLMPSWFYRSQSSIDAGQPAFSTQDDWDAAKADLEKAMRRQKAAAAVVGGGLAQINSDIGGVDRALEETAAQKKDALNDNLDARMDMQEDYQRQYQAMLTNLSRASSVQQQYANIFAGVTSKSPFLSVKA